MNEITEKQEALLQRLSDLVGQMTATAGTRAQDFLTISNGGAAIACLGMIASDSPHSGDLAVKVFLLFFLAGLLLSGVLMVKSYLYAAELAFKFRDVADRLWGGNAQWSELHQLFNPVTGKIFYKRNLRIGIASLAMFSVGAIGASIWLITLSLC